VVALLASLLLWNLPFGGLVLYPFKLIATWLHEMSHGVVMLLSGAGFSHLDIYRDTSGIAYAQRGVGGFGRAAIASAGYMGAALLGASLLVLGQSARRARAILVGFAIALALSLVFWVRNDFGMAAVVAGALACIALARFAGEKTALLLVNFVAAQACINAVLDIRVLFRPTLVIDGEVVRVSDAHNMAAASFGSHWLWAGVWLAFSFACFFVALRVTHLAQRRRENAEGREPALPLAEPVVLATAAPPGGSGCSGPDRSPA
jgi:Peptidase M50B-like